MKIYITFGQVHAHSVNGKTFNKDCVAVINCDSHEQGRGLAFEYFEDKFFTSYAKVDDEMMDYFPRGLIEVNPIIEEE